MRNTLQAWDEAVLLALNGQPRWLDTPAWWLTSNWAAVPVVLLILVARAVDLNNFSSNTDRQHQHTRLMQ